MKLLLCSQGFTNKTIEKKFFEMVGKKPEEISLAYIPTAVNMAPVDDKRWMIKNLTKLDELEIGSIDIVDFSAIPKDVWQKRLEKVDVIYIEGGTGKFFLAEIKKVGFDEFLKKILNDKVIVGCSVGGSFLGEKIVTSSSVSPGYSLFDGLGFFDFGIRPHFYRKDRSQFSEEKIAEIARELNTTFYAIDDETAISVEDGNVEVISEGRWRKYDG